MMVLSCLPSKKSVLKAAAAPNGSMSYGTTQWRSGPSFLCFYVSLVHAPPQLEPPDASTWPLEPPIGLSDPLTALMTIYLASQTLQLAS